MEQAAIIEAVAKEWYVWTVAKLIAGIGIGAVQATLPVVSIIFISASPFPCRFDPLARYEALYLTSHPATRSFTSLTMLTYCAVYQRTQSRPNPRLLSCRVQPVSVPTHHRYD